MFPETTIFFYALANLHRMHHVHNPSDATQSPSRLTVKTSSQSVCLLTSSLHYYNVTAAVSFPHITLSCCTVLRPPPVRKIFTVYRNNIAITAVSVLSHSATQRNNPNLKAYSCAWMAPKNDENSSKWPVASPASGHVGTCPLASKRIFFSLGYTLKLSDLVWYYAKLLTQHYVFSRITRIRFGMIP